MGFKIKNSFLLVILILLQSCSGGRIGNFLESSFKNIEEPKIKVDNKNNVKNKKTISNQNNQRSKNKIMSKNISGKRRKFQPQSYKIIFILKDVDPKDPIEDLSTILRNSDVNFEIEKIERFFDSKSKSIKE